MPGDEGYDAFIESVAAEMDAQHLERTNANNPASVPIPDYVPDKFRNAPDPFAAMAKSYAELEAKFGGAGKPPVPNPTTIPAKPAVVPPATVPAVPPSATDTVPPAVVTPPAIPALESSKALAVEAGLDFNELYSTYVSQGSLTEEQFVKLESAGRSREFITQHIAGIEAVQRESQRELFGVAGGEEQYTSMVTWAADNLKPDEIAAFNDAIESTNKNIQKLAISNLKMQFTAQAPPTLLTGRQQVQGSSTDIFTSETQVVAAMSDPRYGNDPAFQKYVGDKLARSPGVF